MVSLKVKLIRHVYIFTGLCFILHESCTEAVNFKAVVGIEFKSLSIRPVTLHLFLSSKLLSSKTIYLNRNSSLPLSASKYSLELSICYDAFSVFFPF